MGGGIWTKAEDNMLLSYAHNLLPGGLCPTFHSWQEIADLMNQMWDQHKTIHKQYGFKALLLQTEARLRH